MNLKLGTKGVQLLWKEDRNQLGPYKCSIEAISKSRSEKQMGETVNTSHFPLVHPQDFTFYYEYGSIICGEMKEEQITLPS